MPRKFAESLSNALRGLRFSYRSQRNMTLHTAAAAAAVILGLLLRISFSEMALIILLIASVIVLELLNTAIEEIVNMLTLSRKMRAMVAKDVSAAAVLVAAISAVVIGGLIFVPRIINLFIYGG
jgi:diacylglycerol kinase